MTFPLTPWIWHPALDAQATNSFTYFQKKFTVEKPSPHAAVLFAADANARLLINGVVLRRKVTRYAASHVRPERVLIGPYLRAGENTVLVLHHNWGRIKTFQRVETRRAGLWLQPANDGTPAALATDTTWQAAVAPEFTAHTQQIIGVTGDLRIRFPVIIDGAKRDLEKLAWTQAVIVADPVWNIVLDEPLTPQREYPFLAQGLVAAGRIDYPSSFSATAENLRSDFAFSEKLDEATYHPDEALTRAWARLPLDGPLTLKGRAGETFFFTFDFHQPVHGYPALACRTVTPGIALTLGYAELAISHYDGTHQVDALTGKIRTQQIAGKYYGDRYLTAGHGSSVESFEFPDERTARYLALHVTFPADGPAGQEISLGLPAIIRSQFAALWRGSFDAGHPRLAQITALSRIHAEVTMSDTYVDTPGREDGQWLEDIQLRARAAETWCADGELRRRTLLHAEETRDQGRFLAFAPQSFVYITQWDWGMQWITMLHDEWHWHGDRAFLHARLPALESYTSLLIEQINAEGFFCSDYVFADIRVGRHAQKKEDVSVIVHAWLIERLQQAAGLAREANRADLSAKWLRVREQLIAAFHAHLVLLDADGLPYAADQYETGPRRATGKSQAAQISAIESGLFTGEQARRILEKFFPAPFGRAPEGIDPWNNPTYSQRALKVLSDHGLGERALAHLIWRYDPYLPASASNNVPLSLQGPLGGPLPEYFISHVEQGLATGQPCSGQPHDATGSHGWAAMPLVWLHETLLGVSWSTAGSRLQIAPQTFGLPFVNGHVSTPRGTVFLNWEPAFHRLEIELPVDVETLVTLPSGEGWRVLSAPTPSAFTCGESARQFKLTSHGRYVIGL